MACLERLSACIDILSGGHCAPGLICVPVPCICLVIVPHCSCFATSSVGDFSRAYSSGHVLPLILYRPFRPMLLFLTTTGDRAPSGGGLVLLLSTQQ